MKLSEAIRKGSQGNKQIFGNLAVEDQYGHVVGTCAMGAALHALKKYDLNSVDSYVYLREEFPLINYVYGPVDPIGQGSVEDLFSAIWLWNDSLGLTREEIADRVAKFEIEVDHILGTKPAKILQKVTDNA